MQVFHVIDVASGQLTQHRSTTRAWTDAELAALLGEAGFDAVALQADWPQANDALVLWRARKQ